jgi:serine/threonine protein kinase
MKDFYVTGPNYCVVLEYCSRGDLGKLIAEHAKKKEHLPQRQIMHYLLNIASALAFAHELDVLHRDIKPQNIFVCSETVVKVGDFGAAKIVEDANVAAEGARTGTRIYMVRSQTTFCHASGA